jgi:DNA polymerase-3 subunit gamma/tau
MPVGVGVKEVFAELFSKSDRTPSKTGSYFGRKAMYQALYRKWRPRDFESVCGQEHITSVLKHEIKNDRYSHAYLFCGSRGTGKTTCAKLLAKAVNCLDPIDGSPCGKCEACRAIDEERTTDVIEMDAASNTGVDYIRDIREAVMYAPSMLKNRVYIIDEVHMLTQSAFNALLKTLEEPPSRVVFILATTEQQKIPSTILSRCQRFEFRRIAADVIADRLMYISEQEGIKTEPAAAKVIAKMAQGGMRDAISLLELCAGDGKTITLEAVKSVTGAVGRETAAEAVTAVINKDTDALFEIIAKAVASAKEITVFWQELIDFYRDMLVFKTAKSPERFLDLTGEEFEMIKSLTASMSGATLLAHCKILEDTHAAMLRQGASKRLCAEMAFLKMCDGALDSSAEGLAARITALEERAVGFAGGVMPTLENAPKNPQAVQSTVAFKKATVAPKTDQKPIISSNPPEVRQAQKPAPWWAEATKKVSENMPYIAPFMKQARAYEMDDRLLIKVEGLMTQDMLNTPEMRGVIASLSAAYGKTQYAPEKLEFMIAGKLEDDEVSPIDELGNV